MYNVIDDPGHSISFEDMNTWKRWGLFPTSRPFVAPPEPRIKIEEVDGVTGVLDYSDILTTDRFYKDRTGSWEFMFIPRETPILKWEETSVKNLRLSNPTKVNGGLKFLVRKSFPYLQKGIYKVVVDGKESLYEIRYVPDENYWELGYEPGRVIPKFHAVFTKTAEHQYYLDYIEQRTTDTSKSITVTIYHGVPNGFYELSWRDVYKDLYTNLHGKYFEKIRLEDDPGWTYKGRVWISNWKNSQQETNVTIDYELYPFKTWDTDNLKDWQWNELFDNITFFGPFKVAGSKWRNVINPTENNFMATVTTDAAMKVYNENLKETTNLVKGKNDKRLRLRPGSNILKFTGNGTVTIDYIKETSL